MIDSGGEDMARVSRKSIKEQKSLLAVEQYAFLTALYVRLSLEEQEGDLTEKIRNQRELLLEYIREKPEFQLVDIYCDNGCSGTNFDRPQWQRLMEDAKAGKICPGWAGIISRQAIIWKRYFPLWVSVSLQSVTDMTVKT